MSKTIDQKKTPRVEFATCGDGLPSTGFVRLASIIGPNRPIPVSKSTWWDGVKSGRFPKPIKLGPNTTAWAVADIRALIARLAAADGVEREP